MPRETGKAITSVAIDAIRARTRFDKEDITTHPAELELTGQRTCDLTIYEGKHHQIKRMFARYRVGECTLGDLPCGAYRHIAPFPQAG